MEELTEIEGTLEKHVTPFIEYDIEATKRLTNKIPQITGSNGRRRGDEETQGIYV